MSTKDLISAVSFTEKGAVLLGEHVSCDGFHRKRDTGAITHIHEDHLTDYQSSLKQFDPIFMSQESRDLIIALEGPHLEFYRNLKAVDLGKQYECHDDKVTLFPAVHILGACQVMVETRNTSLVYTGDFYYPGTIPLETDVLVVDATYGSPSSAKSYDRNQQHITLSDLVSGRCKRGEPVYIFSRRGKLQHLMHVLRVSGIDVPFISSEKEFRIAQVYSKYGMPITNLTVESSEVGGDILQKGGPYVGFYTMSSRPRHADGHLGIRVSSWAANQPVITTRNSSVQIALSDHADYEGTMEFIQECKPKVVVTQNRGDEGNAQILAYQIRKHLGIPAYSSDELTVLD